MERELRALKMRVTDLEVELCSKDIIIAQQDAVIHRFTSSLRSQRFHRSIVPLDEVSHSDFPHRGFQRRRAFSAFAEQSKTNVTEMVQAQQMQIKLLVEQLSKCRVP